jgi:hypothetical protein
MTTTQQEGYEALKEQLAPLSRVSIVSAKVAEVLSDRLRTGHERYRTRLTRIGGEPPTWPWVPLSTPIEAWKAWTEYALDTAERTVLFWDTLRRRGDAYLEHERAGHLPLLHFQRPGKCQSRRDSPGCATPRGVSHA